MAAARPTIDAEKPHVGEPIPLRARRHPLVHQLASNLRDRCGVPSSAKVVLGVSGGADSLALAIGCAVLARRGALDPLVVHVHHHLRSDADDDAAHVAEFCRRLALPLQLRHVHPRGAAGNLSSAAREARYSALVDAAGEAGASFVAVAHHALDQFETILMSLCRGSEAGLAGMRWTRPLNARDHAVQLIRPLLDVARHDCEDLCSAAGVTWRSDPTNVDRAQARARVRADVVPVLESLWPGAAGRAVGSIQALAEARHLIEQLLDLHFGPASQRAWPRTELAALPPTLLTAGLRRAALAALGAEHADDLSRARCEQIAFAIRDTAPAPRRFELPGGLACLVRARDVVLEQMEQETSP